MAGIRIGGVAFIPSCSPPFGAFGGSDTLGDAQVWRACVGDTAGCPNAYTDYNDAGVTEDGCHNPVLSPDELWILFEMGNSSTGYTEIWVVANTPGSTPTQVLADASNYYKFPNWGPDSDTFCVIHGDGGTFNGSIEVTSVSDPGTVDVIITEDGTDAPQRPQFNPAGTQIAYWWDTITGTGLELRICDTDGSNDALLDSTATGSYRFQGPQFGWANDGSLIAYDTGEPSSPVDIYVIEPDGTNRVKINSAGDGDDVGRISDKCFPPDDSFVVIAANLGSGYCEPIRCELDGSTTFSLNSSQGANTNAFANKVTIYNSRIWWIGESTTELGSCALDGTDYRLDLDMGAETCISFFTGGDGFWFD